MKPDASEAWTSRPGSSTDAQGWRGHGTRRRWRDRDQCLHCDAPRPAAVSRGYYICQSCADHCRTCALTECATEFIAAGASLAQFIVRQGQGDILCVLANYGVTNWLDVSKLGWDRLHDLTEMLGDTWGVGFAAVLRCAYVAVGSTDFSAFPDGQPPAWLQAGLLPCIPEFPPGLEQPSWSWADSWWASESM